MEIQKKIFFLLKKVKYYNFFNEEYNHLESLDFEINFNKENILNSIFKI